MEELDPVRRILLERGCEDHVVRAGLSGLVEAWEKTAAQVEAGYPLGLDDYLNDMDGRQILESALGAAGVAERGILGERVRAADTRIKARVRQVGECLWGRAVGEAEGWTAAEHWWYFNVPRKPGPLLQQDLDGEE